MDVRNYEIEGCVVTVERASIVVTGPLAPGEMYVGERNTGPQLLVCREDDIDNGWVMPTTIAYPYNRHECRRVVAIDGEPLTTEGVR